MPHSHDLSLFEIPPILVTMTAITCGVLAAMALQIYLAAAGYDVAGLWQETPATRVLHLRAAGPWWAIAGLAFLVGGAVAAVLSRRPPPWPLRSLRWLLGAA